MAFQFPPEPQRFLGKTRMTDFEIFSAAGSLPVHDVLALRAWLSPEERVFTFLDEDGHETDTLSYLELWRRASAVAEQLVEQSTEGDRVVLFYPPGLDFVVAFFGCLLGRRTAVPVNLPARRRLDRTRGIVVDCGATVVLAPVGMVDELKKSFEDDPLDGVAWIGTDDREVHVAPSQASVPTVMPDQLAYFQYTSGSTSNPKGVMITHANVTTNCRMIRDTLRLEEGGTWVFWQPHYHDMGLICAFVLPVVNRNHAVLMAPNTFVRQPLLWLKTISKYRAEMAGGPNFAFDLAVERFAEARMEGVDLSCWRLALNGSDIVRAGTLARFTNCFSRYGYRSETFLVCYGMAEAVLFLSAGPIGLEPFVREIDADLLEGAGKIAVPRDGARTRDLVGCGEPSWEIDVLVVDPETRRAAAPGNVGEIWLAGPTIGAGYWNNLAATEKTFHARCLDKPDRSYLRSGDLGFVDPDNGQIYICGRIKDLIITEGRNIHPEDIERTILDALDGSKSLSCAVFAYEDHDQQRIVAAIEVDRALKRRLINAQAEVERLLRQQVSSENGVTLFKALFIPPSSMCKTTSGKVQRGLMQRLYVSGGLTVLDPSMAVE